MIQGMKMLGVIKENQAGDISYMLGHANPFQADIAPADPRAFAEPIDIVPKLPTSLQSTLTSPKWKERKEVLDDLSTLLTSTSRIKEAPELGELAKSLAVRVQGDANINCVMTAAACMEALAKGMMASFARYRELVVAPMLERLKERKANVTDAIGKALDGVFATVSHWLWISS
jgi:cytoskeleton-associated protein 5